MSAVMKLRSENAGTLHETARHQARFHVVLHQGVRQRAKGGSRGQWPHRGDDFVQNHYYDIGVAVGTERGLIVP
jgi:2-oxoglutarate dehydrogenase E2 component (dihydrolipoamide succinyltransferase)